MTPSPRRSFLQKYSPNQEWVLFFLLAFEILVFSLVGERFLTVQNAFEITRSGTEIGLLALAMTLVMKTGGIDLSVGSVMGLAAVTLGSLWADAGLAVWLAAALAVLAGAACGTINGWLVTRLRLPPLIVTLGSMALWRGLAEGWTGGYAVYTGFPASFLALGQGYVGPFPAQLSLFVAALVSSWILLHRTPFGRELKAIGFSLDGARHAGIDVRGHLLRVYLLSGLAAGAAGVLYASHLGQAKADAGTGYELAAITIVVLGGAAIRGGRGTIHGTLLALAILAVLQNGLCLAGQPGELYGILLGALLVSSVLLNRVRARRTSQPRPTAGSVAPASLLTSGQLSLLAAAILVAALLVATSWYVLVRALVEGKAG